MRRVLRARAFAKCVQRSADVVFGHPDELTWLRNLYCSLRNYLNKQK